MTSPLYGINSTRRTIFRVRKWEQTSQMARERIAVMYRNGLSRKEIAVHTGFTEGLVKKFIEANIEDIINEEI